MNLLELNPIYKLIKKTINGAPYTEISYTSRKLNTKGDKFTHFVLDKEEVAKIFSIVGASKDQSTREVFEKFFGPHFGSLEVTSNGASILVAYELKGFISVRLQTHGFKNYGLEN